MQPEAGTEIGVLAQDVSRLGGLRPVSLHDLRPIDDQLPDLAYWQLLFTRLDVHDAGVGVWPGDADEADLVALQWVDVCGGTALGQTIGFDQRAVSKVLESLLDLAGQRRGSAETSADGTQIEVAYLRMVVDSDVHGRHSRVEGSPMLADRAHDVQDVARIGDEHHCQCSSYAHVHHRSHSVGMEQGQGADGDILFFAAVGPDKPGDGVRNQVAVSQLGALGHTGCPSCIEQYRSVLRSGRGRLGCWPAARSQGCKPVIFGCGQFHAVSSLLLFHQCEEQAQHRGKVLLDVGHDHVP